MLILNKIRSTIILAGCLSAWICQAIPPAENHWKPTFSGAAKLAPVNGLTPQEEAFSVLDADGMTLGWVFRTDRLNPPVKGHISQIACLVSLSTNASILGIKVLEHTETPLYFSKLRNDFFTQFKELPADTALPQLDTVTGATHSSTAIVRDVLEGIKRLIELPAVKARINSIKNPANPKP
ncbi:MAG: hypothetical protein A2269_07405 [Lentisphaerae bacterium RIFOXYA12_FULL_60_10]|nr:MAG: hypothetical protein A2269_07405 [Lentisphaerae bacterium RIFOXYA12_FULL_60_10]